MFPRRRLLLGLVAVIIVSVWPVAAHDARELTALVSQEAAAAEKYYDTMLQRVNWERSQKGLSKLCYNKKLTQAAQAQSDDLARTNRVGHTGSDGSDFVTRVKRTGYKFVTGGENAGGGYKDVEAAMWAWMGSSGHKANILNSKVTQMGMGYSFNGNTKYQKFWTQVFAVGSGEACDGEVQSDATTTTTAPKPNIDPTPARTPAPVPTVAPSPAPNLTAAPTPTATLAPRPIFAPAPTVSPAPAPTATLYPTHTLAPVPTGAPAPGLAPAPAPAPAPVSTKKTDCLAK